jgi:CubicO group peptidase (beta-lactamase class C family)
MLEQEIKAVSHRGMGRREFLVESNRAAIGFSLLPLVARGQGNHKSADLRDDASGETLIADLEKLIPKLMAELSVPGASIAVIKDAKLFWRRGFGVKDVGSKAPVDNDTVFEAASVSKTVFAYAVMKLCEKGVIGLDTPLTKYAPKPFLEGDSRLELITARHVLSHTSGFQNWRSKDEPLKIHFTPGEKFFYSGEGYSYLQSVVTHLTGRPIEPYLKANLFEPFGMVSSGYGWNDIFEKHAARPHTSEGKPLNNKKRTAEDVARFAAAGDLHTTPTDYAKFLIEVINPKKSDAYRLDRKSLAEMVRPQVKVDGSKSWALGWQIQHGSKGDQIQHGGNNRGFHAFASASVERKSGFIIMTNGDNGWKLFSNQVFAEVMTRFLVG